MYRGHARLSVSIRNCMPTLLHGPGCNLREWYGMPRSCALLGGFAIGARVALTTWREREMAASGLYSLYALLHFA